MKNYLNIRLESTKKDITKHNIRNKNSIETKDQDKIKIANSDIENFILFDGEVEVLTKDLQRKIRRENRIQQKEAEAIYIELYKKRSANRKPKKNYSAIGNGVMTFSEAIEFDLDKKYSKEDLFQAANKTLKDFEEKTGTRIIENSLVLHMDESGLPHFHFTFENFDSMGYSIIENLKRNKHEFDLSNLQDILFDNFKDMGFDRGIKKTISGATHKNTRQYQREQDLLIIEKNKEISVLNSKLKTLLNFTDLVENLEKYSLEDIDKFKAFNKTNKPISQILNNLFRARNQMLKGQDSEKAMNLAKTKIDKWNELAATAEINYNSMIDKQEFIEWKKNKNDFVPLKTYEDMKGKFIKASKDRDTAIENLQSFKNAYEVVQEEAEAKIEAIEKDIEDNLQKMKWRTRTESNKKINALNYDKKALQKDFSNVKALLDNEKSLTDKLINKGKALGVGPDILEVRDQHIEDLKPKKKAVDRAKEHQAKRKEVNEYEDVLNDIEDLENKHNDGFRHR